MKQIEINGALLIDILKGVSVECYSFNGEYWGVLARTRDKDAGQPFIEYRTDEWGDFQIVDWHEGDIRKVTKKFLDRINGIPDIEHRKRGRPVGTTKEAVKGIIKGKLKPNNPKHMSRGEWLALQKEGKL